MKIIAKELNSDSLVEFIEENNWVKYIFYAGGLIVGIWVLGKASKLLSDAVINFKTLHNAIQYRP